MIEGMMLIGINRIAVTTGSTLITFIFQTNRNLLKLVNVE